MHFSVCAKNFLRRCIKDIHLSQRWAQFDLPKPILLPFGRLEIKNISSAFLCFGEVLSVTL